MFRLFKKKTKPSLEKAAPEAAKQPDVKVVDEHGNPEDHVLAAMVNEAFRSGGMVVGNVDEDGKLTIERRPCPKLKGS